MVITAIGFANKYYTLWQISEETRPLGNGRSYVITHYTYVKNISFDKETALAKYPGAILDENLRGMTASWDSAPKEIWDNVDTFRFGKYAYTKITDNTDTKYIAWYWEQVSDEHKDFVKEVLKSRGYEVRTHNWISYDGTEKTNEYLISPEDLEIEREDIKNYNIIKEKVQNNEVLTFVPNMNLTDEGEYRDGNILYHFPEVKENYYNDWVYYTPVLKGKAKRFKNRTVIVKSYSFEEKTGYILVNVNDFEIVK